MKKVALLVLACLLSLAAQPVAAMGAQEPGKPAASAAPEQPLEISWLGYPVGGMFPEETAYVVQELNKRFNVKLKPIKADSNKPAEMNLLFASGEIPDHILVAAKDIARFLEQGLFRKIPADMVKGFSPTFYERVLDNHPHILNSTYFEGGSFWAVPEGRGELFPLTVVRTDWLDKVGAKMPTNLAEFENVCRLFTLNDPDGDGKANTYGQTMVCNYDVYNLAAVFGFSLPFGTVKDDSWIPGKDGRLVKAQVSENYRHLMKYVADLYQKGYVYPDVALGDKDDEALFTNGVVGIKTYDWTPFIRKYKPSDWFALTFKKNPNARTDYMPPLKGFGGEEAVYELQSNIWRYMCSGRNTSDAKLRKILEIQEAQLSNAEIHDLVWRGTKGVHFTVDEDGMAILNKEYATNEKQVELGIRFFMCNLRYGQQLALSFGNEAEVMSKLQETYKKVNQAIPAGTVIKSVLEYGADVKKIEQEFFLNAVAGIWKVDDEWNAYLKRWNAAGGDKITTEVNEIYKAMKK